MPNYVEHRDRSRRIESSITAIHAILPLNLYPAHKRELLNVCVWKITEADGKHKVRYWSEGAVGEQSSHLIHEHVFTRRELIERLLTGEKVESVVCDAVACLVTPQEHQVLGDSSGMGWQRYKNAGIRVFDAKWQKWCW